MIIYIVVGSTGEYSDRYEWYVCAYRDKQEAEIRVSECKKKAKEWESVRDNDFRGPPDNHYECDPNMRMDYTGTDYYLETTELIE